MSNRDMFDKRQEPVNASTWPVPTVKLVDGTEVLSDSEAWRLECEGRTLMNLPSREARRMYLEDVQRKRGMKGRDKLEAKLVELWNIRRAACNPNPHNS